MVDQEGEKLKSKSKIVGSLVIVDEHKIKCAIFKKQLTLVLKHQ